MIRFLMLVFLGVSALDASAQTLTGFARLPAQTFVVGPTSGQKIETKDGLVALPFRDKQPIQGFSSLSRLSKTEFWALQDNGFGAKSNSADALLRLVRLKIEFKTRKGGSGSVEVVSSLLLSDPNRLSGFPLTREDRRLTGADFDPESLVVARDGTFWIGEEFGPFLLHFSQRGELLDAPFAIDGVASPDEPTRRTATIKSSRGFEGLALSPDKTRVWEMLEGALFGEDPRSLHVFEFDLLGKKWTGWQRFYRLDAPGADGKLHSIGELVALAETRYLVIERDGLEGDAARFKRIFEWDSASGQKKLVVDLLHIADPDGLSGPRNGTYQMPFQTIESVVVVDKRHLLVCNDNNFPFGRARGAGEIEATEFALIELPAPLF